MIIGQCYYAKVVCVCLQCEREGCQVYREFKDSGIEELHEAVAKVSRHRELYWKVWLVNSVKHQWRGASLS